MFNIPFLRGRKSTGGGVAIEGENIKLVVGLGNPGDKYKNTYHNVGFLFVDFLAENSLGDELGEMPKWKSVKSFRYTKLGNLVLLKPTSFMNKSGIAVKEAVKYFDISPEQVLIVHDDSDLQFESYKLSFGRGSAGHRGVDSIFKILGSKDILRLRIGIRKNGKKAEEFVLGKATKEDLVKIEKLFGEIKANYFKV